MSNTPTPLPVVQQASDQLGHSIHRVRVHQCWCIINHHAHWLIRTLDAAQHSCDEWTCWEPVSYPGWFGEVARQLHPVKWGKRWIEHNLDEVRQATDCTQPGWSEASNGMNTTRIKWGKRRNAHNLDEVWQVTEWTQPGWNVTYWQVMEWTQSSSCGSALPCEVGQAMEWTQPRWMSPVWFSFTLWSGTSNGMNTVITNIRLTKNKNKKQKNSQATPR